MGVATFDGRGVDACTATFLFSEFLCRGDAKVGFKEYEVEGMVCIDCITILYISKLSKLQLLMKAMKAVNETAG
jgi:hypothetical protein